jgi:hypothetical protein
MFVRKKKNKSGSFSVQILKKEGRKNILVKTVGSSKDLSRVEELYQEALRLIPVLEKQSTFNFISENDEKILAFSQTLNNTNISMVGAELVFGTLLGDPTTKSGKLSLCLVINYLRQNFKINHNYPANQI